MDNIIHKQNEKILQKKFYYLEHSDDVVSIDNLMKTYWKKTTEENFKKGKLTIHTSLNIEKM